jgi:phosphoribosylcarboxyaminoimidazole (NCAIR) mutase
MSGQGPGLSGQDAEAGAIARLPRVVWTFVAVAVLAVPVFAHGCHGADVDHEPLLIPVRLNPEDR